MPSSLALDRFVSIDHPLVERTQLSQTPNKIRTGSHRLEDDALITTWVALEGRYIPPEAVHRLTIIAQIVVDLAQKGIR